MLITDPGKYKKTLNKLKGQIESSANHDLFNSTNTIKYNQKHLSIEELKRLINKFNYIVANTPDVSYYAKVWLEILFDPSAIKTNDESIKKRADLFKSRLPISVFDGKFERSDSQLLYSRLYIIANILMPIILIESGIGFSNDLYGLTKMKYINNKVKFVKAFDKYVELYKRKLKRHGLLEYLAEFDRLKEPRENNNSNLNGCITRSQFAFMIFEFACVTNTYQKSAAKSVCRSLLKEHLKSKATSKALYILCCVVFELLHKHSKPGSKEQKRISTCYEHTSMILNSIAPKKYDASPCYTISKRVVEFAITGK